MNVDALRISREALGWTQTDLAGQSGLEQSDISRWERGLRIPNEDQLAQLSLTLRVPGSLLASDVRLTQPVHRTQRAETKRVERMVNGRIELARLAASRMLADLNIDTPFEFPTADDPAPPDPEDAADAIRRVWRVPAGPIRDLTALIESAGAVVLPVDFGDASVLAAYAHLRGDHRWCFLNTRSVDGARVRFSLAHELGHALLHWDRFDAPDGKDAEREAHRFAAAFLMPRRDMVAALGRIRFSLDELVTYRMRWGVSVQALITRARDLRLISPDQYTRLWKQISARGWRRSEPGNVPLERPSVLSDALTIHRTQHGYSDSDLAQISGLGLDRLAELLPEHFVRREGRRPTLSVVR
ncbi:XRE family transcriptional regulator [Conexibacter sp. CPCC 206217]|uniref:XRE family transcriptional regulator n=1 Tax=Conexibacter sp. CPCC 206217 TaxID=3064574 RepID=UPI0027229775|nr:XRE family transcriptional regulator [Conexibacter sp. CPCC 206217]MDO8209649.1 XRE family transcriptional regulator [Conexibacter sp. CPCC 206217]